MATERVQRLDALHSYLARIFNSLAQFVVAGTTSGTTASLRRVMGLVKVPAIHDKRHPPQRDDCRTHFLD